MSGGTWKHAPGFYEGDRPRIVTSRFEYEDSFTLERYLQQMATKVCVQRLVVQQLMFTMKSRMQQF
jgi:hypothetical protein